MPCVLLYILPTAAVLAALVVFWFAPARPTKALCAPFLRRNYAHRGLFSEDQAVPENSLPAFTAAARAGYGIELDVQFTADRKLVVFHDDTLDRMTPGHGYVQDIPWEAMQKLPLKGTPYSAPLFSQMLAAVAAEGKNTPLIVEIKSRHTHAGAYLDALCCAVLAALENYPGPYCIESFDPRVVLRIRRMAPNVLRGQLADSYREYRKTSRPLHAFALSHCVGNVAARPQFIAWGPAPRNWAVRLCAALGAMMVYWTALPEDDAARLQARHDAVIFQWYAPPTRY